MNLRSFDLNLLVVLSALLEERSVMKAGQRVGLSQSATSHALDRLRKIFEDDLFVRTAAGMEPTERALSLAEPLRLAMQNLRALLEPTRFEPGAADGCFNIATQTYGTIIVLPQLASLMRHDAPGMELTVKSGSTSEILNYIDQGDVDVGIGVFAELQGRYMTRRLLSDGHVCLMREKHPLAGAPLTLGDYLAASHLQISMAGAIEDSVDAALAARDLRRRIMMRLPHGLATMIALAQSDMIASVTASAAQVFARSAPLVVSALPFDVPMTNFCLVWNPLKNGSPRQVWLRSMLVKIAASLEPAGPEAASGRG